MTPKPFLFASLVGLSSFGVVALLEACSTSVDLTPLHTSSLDAGRDARTTGTTSGDPNPDPDPDPDPDPRPDAAAPDGSVDPDDASVEAEAGPPPVKRVFVTKMRYSGDLKTAGDGTDGADGADKLCATAAASASLGGTWKAWVSTADGNAIDRIADVSPWYLVDTTTLVFANKTELAKTPAHAINRNETGTISIEGAVQRTWTGTGVGGKKSTSTCTNWSTETGSGVVGVFTESDADWTRYAIDPSDPCASKYPIYCFEQ